MKKRMLMLTITFIFGFFIMSGGYGLWQKKIVIKGAIEIVKPQQVTTPSSIIINNSQVTTSNSIEVESQNVVNEIN